MCTRRSAVCKKLLAALLAVTTTLGLFGCGGNEEAPKEDKTAEPATEKEPSGTDYLPVEMMSREETKQLTAGTVIEVDDLKAIPDERVLDDLDLAVVYRYHTIETSEDASDEWTYYFSYGDTCSLRRENDEVVEEALNFFFHNDELKADEVYFPFTDSDALIYTKYEPQENYDITRFRAIKEDPTGWSLTKTQENGNTILTLKIEDPQAYNDYLGTNEPTQIAGVDVDKCEVVCNETIIAVDEDGNIVRYESNVETDYGNGLISHNHYVAEYKYSDLDAEVFTPQESDQLIEQAKALQEEIDQ